MTCQQVREHHRLWKEEGKGSRDVVIFAHGHFNRCLVSRWIGFPLSLGTSSLRIAYLALTVHDVQERTSMWNLRE